MERNLLVVIDSGETSCASRKGVFCDWVSTRIDGANPRCILFGEALDEKDGWLQRHPSCLKAEKVVAA